MMGSRLIPKDMMRVILLPLLFLAVSISSADSAATQETTPDKGKTSNLNDFTYTSQRRDPFERALALKGKNQLGSEALRTGYELEELKLVGVMKAGPEKFAIMEDMQGKGLLFKKGESLNKNMWVSEILEEKVILSHRLRGDTRLISLNIPRK
jgi:Tfp pilus assembly protein PilP